MSQAPDAELCDVLVIGGGPAGTTAAALLAERGVDTIMLEKDAHPRFHIGESLLPNNLRILDRLGLLRQTKTMGVLKPGAEFFSDATGRSIAFPFARSLNRAYTHAYHVRRSEFDELLFTNARRRGVRASEHNRVTEITFAARPGARARVMAITPGGPRLIAPRFVLDASGRDTFMANRLRTKKSNKHINNTAVFAHYRGVATWSGETAGYIGVHLAEDGWFWMIPLDNEVMSVGFVGTPAAYRQRDGSMSAFFERRLQESPTVSIRMAGAERISEVRATGNFSYRARSAWGDGWMMVGDAFAFLDPIFSSGVLLAMRAGELGAETAAAWLRDPAAGRAAARAAERELRAAMVRISWLIYRINCPVLRSMFMSPSDRLRMRDGVITVLAGYLDGDWRTAMPLLAVKATYHALRLSRCLGWTPPGNVAGDGGESRALQSSPSFS